MGSVIRVDEITQGKFGEGEDQCVIGSGRVESMKKPESKWSEDARSVGKQEKGLLWKLDNGIFRLIVLNEVESFSKYGQKERKIDH